MFQRLLAVMALVLVALPLRAAPPERLDDLIGVLQLDEMLEIMALEGVSYGDDLEEEMFPGRGGARWKAIVAQVYDGARLQALMREALGESLQDAELDPVIAFFASPTGARIVGLEVSARRALLDPGVDEASRETLKRMRAEGDPRLDILERFATVNDLIEMNVAGGLNANYAFFTGLIDGGAFPYAMTEEEVLREVWSQEADLREETEIWLFSYLAMAYQPLPDAALEAYIALSATPQGQAVNQALFDGFDVMFRTVSRDLGLAAAQFIAGEDI